MSEGVGRWVRCDGGGRGVMEMGKVYWRWARRDGDRGGVMEMGEG